MRIFAVLLCACACAHEKPAPARPALLEAVSLEVRADGPLVKLVDQTESHARTRFEAKGHHVTADAPLTVEIEIVDMGGVVKSGVYEYCVKFAGHVERDGQALRPDLVKERCDVVKLTNDLNDPGWRLVGFVAAVTTTMTLERRAPNAQSQLYVGALDELVDALGRQAVRPKLD